MNEDSPDFDSNVGRTKWDIFDSITTSRAVWAGVFGCIFGLFLWIAWDAISAIPLYVVSSVLLSTLWYGSFYRWLSSRSTFVEVWEPESGLFTTWRVGSKALARMNREGIQNIVYSRMGSSRIFASQFEPHLNILKNAWVHDCDIWTYHIERNTLFRLTNRLVEVYHDISDSESMSMVEGRRNAMLLMRRHYRELDKLFEGGVHSDEEVNHELIEQIRGLVEDDLVDS